MKTAQDRELEFFNKRAEESSGVPHWWGNRSKSGQLRQERRAKMVTSLFNLREGMKVLEIGCADGEFTRRFENLGAQIIAVDISPQMINNARKLVSDPNIQFETGDVENLVYKENTFDIIIGNAILHHLNIDKVLPELKRVLKSDGKVFFTEPNLRNPIIWAGVHIRPLRKLMQLTDDETAFYRQEIAKKFSQHGFRNVVVTPFDFMFPLFPDWMIPLVHNLEKILEHCFLKEIGGSLCLTAEK